MGLAMVTSKGTAPASVKLWTVMSSVAALQSDTEHLKDVSGLHLLGEAINVWMDRSVVGYNFAADPLGGARERAEHFHGEGHNAHVLGVLLRLRVSALLATSLAVWPSRM